MDDFDPYSASSKARREQSARRERQALNRGLEQALRQIRPSTTPVACGGSSNSTIPTVDIGPRSRGVYEKEASWPGTRSFLVVAESGAKLMDVTVPEDIATGRFIHSLYRFLEREDPRRTLRAV